MRIFPPTIISVVVSNFFTESIRFDMFVPISSVSVVVVVVGGLSTGGRFVVLVGIGAY